MLQDIDENGIVKVKWNAEIITNEQVEQYQSNKIHCENCKIVSIT